MLDLTMEHVEKFAALEPPMTPAERGALLLAAEKSLRDEQQAFVFEVVHRVPDSGNIRGRRKDIATAVRVLKAVHKLIGV